MGAGETTDAALNDNTASNQLTFHYDVTNPTVTIASSKPTDTNTEPIDLTFTFNEVVVDFVEADLGLTNCEVDAGSFLALSTTLFTAVVSPLAEGTVQVALAAASTTDLSGNELVASSIQFVYDVTSPTPTITTSAGSYTRVDPIPFTVEP